MRNNYRTKAFKLWLDKLQQESWQLELIISGFSIYGLSQVFEPLIVFLNIAENEKNIAVIILLFIALTSCTILMFTLLLHVVLRGLWIGALGLRYVSGDIDYKALNYRPKFDRYLRRKIGSFDKYISRLEDYCSVLFAISFLLIFYILSIFVTFGAIVAISYFLLNDYKDRPIVFFVIGLILLFFVLFGMLFTFIDFVTQGYLKKNKWLAKIYFPFYWAFSYLTLSFLYRPLVHNFIDNRFGKRLSILLVPVYFILIGITSFSFNRSNYFSSSDTSNTFTANKFNYDENITEKGMFIRNASIPSKIIETRYLPVFIAFSETIEDAIFNFNHALKPDKDIRGYKSGIVFSDDFLSFRKKDSLKTVYMRTLSEMYKFKIDSIEYKNLEFIFTEHNNSQNGFETVISLDSITDGKHNLRIYRAYKHKDSIKYNWHQTIPFWYFKKQ
ncbi:LTA synthase family protein [Olleya aquimaris]|uniref:Uncharacterized protein n=1 Tax=Olleya aquimaris TaxID=639310 RepID=A0A327RH21_9FLAO|nr:hypothetical protein [Olleya aquimaris]RAJ13027.1 hypothetical protein LY08_02309 [Olleya aquimaris]